MGKIHKRIIENNQSSCVSGIVDLDIEKLNSYKKEITIYKNINEIDFKKAKYDAAIISSNTSSHYEIGKTLLENEVPFLVEKPITTNEKEFDEIVEESLKKKLIIRCGILETYNPIFNYIKNLKLDDIKSIHIFRHSQKITGRDVDNVIFDLVIHDLSVLIKLFPDSKIEIISKNYDSNKSFLESVDIFIKINDIPILISASRESQSKLRNWSIKTEDKDYQIDLINKEINIFESGFINIEDDFIVSNNLKNTKKSFSNSKESAEIQINEFIKNLADNEIDMEHFNLFNETHKQLFKINEF
tara:strand:+ start:1194 stop:2096 length:903 start_codon:yes stop_codon:yes gene_type:complete